MSWINVPVSLVLFCFDIISENYGFDNEETFTVYHSKCLQRSAEELKERHYCLWYVKESLHRTDG